MCSDYFLKRQTYDRAIHLIDKFLVVADEIKAEKFQLVGITCLHIAAKIEEIYPPHIRAFVDSTNDSVTIDQMREMEQSVAAGLEWRLDCQVTAYEWASWFMTRWDRYVDEALGYLKSDFALKFYEGEQYTKYAVLMQFVDAMAIHEDFGKYETARLPLAALFYLIIGGQDVMCAYQIEYAEMQAHFMQH